MRVLADKFYMSNNGVKTSFRDFKELSSRPRLAAAATREFKRLLNNVNTLPVSTAARERGFSRCTDLRSTLTVEHLSSLMFISLNGPPQHLWDPLPYVKAWINKGRNHALSVQCPARELDDDSGNELKSIWKLF